MTGHFIDLPFMEQQVVVIGAFSEQYGFVQERFVFGIHIIFSGSGGKFLMISIVFLYCRLIIKILIHILGKAPRTADLVIWQQGCIRGLADFLRHCL